MGEPDFGDVNADYQFNIYDLILLADYVLHHQEPNATEFLRADLDANGVLDLFDVIILVDEILND